MNMKKSFGAKTLIFPTPVWCVGSYDASDKPNVMTVAWGGICCSVPPCVTISLRKATYSYGSIMARCAYTLSVPSEAQVKAADYFGMVSGRDTDKFSDQRGKGLGKLIMAFVEARCAEIGIREVWLTVNRHNADSIAFYRHVGFVTAGTVVQEVGHGFVMDDYKMIKKLVFNK